jgi:uncharacterized protein YegL
MRLTPTYAKTQFEKIRQINQAPSTIREKLTNKTESLNYVFTGTLYSLCSSAPESVKTRPDRIKHIFDNSETTPGSELIEETNALAKDLNAFYKGYREPSEADYRINIKRLASFIAFYSNSQIPDDVIAIYTSSASTSTLKIKPDDLIDNPTTRVPVVLCLDVSASMSGEKIKELNRGVKEFFNAVKDDDIARYSVELCIVTFNSSAKKVLDFAGIDRQIEQFNNINLVASGQTAMGSAVNMALDLLDARKKEYQEKGVDYWQPWLVLMTDGQPTDVITSAADRTTRLINDKKLTIFPIGIGDGANMVRLKQFSPNKEPLRLKGLMIAEFFDWLGKSIKTTSQSAPGTRIKLPPIGWAYLDD